MSIPMAMLSRALIVTLGVGALVISPAARAQGADVVVKNFMFTPMSLTVKTGATVTWKNLDGELHTVVNDAGLFHSSALDQNDTFAFTFTKPGVYRIFCGIHPNMKETIIVQ